MDKRTRDVIQLALVLVVMVASIMSLIISPARPSQATDASQEQTAPPSESQPQEEEQAEVKPKEKSKMDPEVATWAARIDAFNAGTPLEGYGQTFAEAAVELGVDPRLSPAIARVESGSGEACFYECNAWGWGSASWPDWDTAIWAHVSGLAEGYGSELTWEMAETYNADTPDEWYEQVESCMAQIDAAEAPTLAA